MMRSKWVPNTQHAWELVGMTALANMIDGQTGEVFLRDGRPFTAESIERMLAMPYREYIGQAVYWYTEDLPAEETQ